MWAGFDGQPIHRERERERERAKHSEHNTNDSFVISQVFVLSDRIAPVESPLIAPPLTRPGCAAVPTKTPAKCLFFLFSSSSSCLYKYKWDHRVMHGMSAVAVAVAVAAAAAAAAVTVAVDNDVTGCVGCSKALVVLVVFHSAFGWAK
jgi:hypothetical protein